MKAQRARRGGVLAALSVALLPMPARGRERTRNVSRSGTNSFIGRDMARASRPAALDSRRWLPAGLVGAFIATLALTALREELIEIRFDIIVAVKEETRLREERDRWVARVQELRNPERLSALAAQKGFARPDHAIDLRSRLDGSPVADLFAELHSAGGASR